MQKARTILRRDEENTVILGDVTEKQLLESVCAVCDKIIAEKKWSSFKDLEVKLTDSSVMPGSVPFSAYISLQDRKIHLGVASDFDRSVAQMLASNKINADKDNVINSIIYHLLVHEYNHHYYCPNTTYLFKEIMDGIVSVVGKKEVTESKINQVAFEIHNLFSDTVINAIASHDSIEYDRRRYRLGLGLSHLLVFSYTAHKTGFIFPKKFDKALLLFAKSNIYLCGTNQKFYDGIKRYLPKFQEDDIVIEQIVDIFMKSPPLTRRIMHRGLLESDSDEICRRMCDFQVWRTKAEQYAELIYPYLKQRHEFLKNGFTGKGESLADSDQPGNSGSSGADSRPGSESSSGSKNSRSEKRNENQDSRGDNKPKQGQESDCQGDFQNQHDSQRKSPECDGASCSKCSGKPMCPLGKGTPYGICLADDRKGKQSKSQSSAHLSQGSRSWSFGSGILRRIDANFDYLDALYTSRAGNLKLEIEDSKGLGNLEMLKGRFEANCFDPSNIDWPHTRILRNSDGSKQYTFFERHIPLEIDVKVPETVGGLPDLCFVFDSSGSMTFDYTQGRGEYHTAVLTFYSLIKNLEQTGMAYLLKYNVLNFSDVTFASDWKSYFDIRDVKEALLSHQGGGTTIDISKLRSVRENRKDNYLLFLLSDLAISNYIELEQELVATHESRAARVLVFKLGGKCRNSEQLARMGINVYYPQNAETFMDETIRITKQLYSI